MKNKLTEKNINSIRKQIGKKFQFERHYRRQSLRQTVSKLEISIPTSTLHHYETKGVSFEAIRILILCYHYGLTLGRLLLIDPPVKVKYKELIEEEPFQRICSYLYDISKVDRINILKSLEKIINMINLRGDVHDR